MLPTTGSSSHAGRGPGICAMRGSCGRVSQFGADLPCPDDGPATDTTESVRDLLGKVCGPTYQVPDHVCCTEDQVTTLNEQLAQAAPLIASCPACLNNFRTFYCDFTCSPDQSTFLKVTDTQQTIEGKTAIKSVEYQVSGAFANGFFDSCKSVQFGATNGFAMDLIGGGATNASGFLKYMGDLRPGLGSPFQIDYPPLDSPSDYPREPLSCSDGDINSRCACADCPAVCPSLPPQAPPGQRGCHVGAVSCVTFSFLIIYSVAIAAIIAWYGYWQVRRWKKKSQDVDLDPPSSPTTAGTNVQVEGMVGRGNNDDDSSGPAGSTHWRLGRGASLLDPNEHLQPKSSHINAFLRRAFYRLGLACATYPLQVFMIAAIILGVMNAGWSRFSVEKDPVRLWVSPTSEAAEQKAFYDENFGPFYRTEQIFLTSSKTAPLSYDTLDWWIGVEQQIADLRSRSGVALQDVCFAPSGEGTPCVVQSVSAWFGTDMTVWGSKWPKRLEECASHPTECLPDFGQPIDPKLILGGAKHGDWLNARAIVVTYVVNNSNNPKEIKRVEEWEKVLQDFLSHLSHEQITVSFSTGISLERELNKSANTDVQIVLASYIVMFIYVALSLGGSGVPRKEVKKQVKRLYKLLQHVGYSVGLRSRRPSGHISDSLEAIPKLLLSNSKFSLSFFGIAIVLISICTSVGFFSFLGVKVTLIIAEVIPFLVLAVGVDNVFILVNELERQTAMHATAHADGSSENGHGHHGHRHGAHGHHGHDSDSDAGSDVGSDFDEPHTMNSLSAEERVARTLARMGPSILLSSITEVVAFALGALVPMPAVRNFAVYAAGSVLIGAILQMTVFVSALLLDLKRSEAGRMDCLPCFSMRGRIALKDEGPGAVESLLTSVTRNWYAPWILKPQVKHTIMAVFGGMFVLSVIGIQKVQLGLDQRKALPPDSHLVDYFNDVDKYLDVGPPVYFVVKGGHPEKRQGQQELCGRFTTCQELSVANTLDAERKRPESSFIANPPAAWIDDFLMWTNPLFESCCRVRRRDPSIFCRPRDSDRLCQPCFEGQHWDSTMAGLPKGAEFDQYLNQWLQSPADENCPLGGLQGYSHAVKQDDNSTVRASHFRTFHTPLREQADFIHALSAARRIAGEISKSTGLDIFPYSLFYVFFDQYSYIVSMSVEVLVAALGAILAITTILLGSWQTGATVSFTCALAVINVMGVMGFWGIDLNAISLVNLVISVGIAVEFCSHLARAFMGAGTGLRYDTKESEQRDRDERVASALADVGPSIFSGITLTKLVGISVLGLTKSKLLKTYYFKMWLALIVTGALHGLVLLPVLLSYFGGEGYSIEDIDEDWATSQMRRPGEYESAPFADDDDSI